MKIQASNPTKIVFSCASLNMQKETYLSKGARITAIALGTLAIAFSLLVFFKISGLQGVGTIPKWSALLAGGACILLAGILKEVKAISTRTLSQTESQTESLSQRQLEISSQNTLSSSSKSMTLQIVRPDQTTKEITISQDGHPFFTPSWYERRQREGFQCSPPLNLDPNSETMKAILLISDASRTDLNVGKVNFYPLCYRLDDQSRQISVDLQGHNEVFQKTISTLVIDKKRYFSNMSTKDFFVSTLGFFRKTPKISQFSQFKSTGFIVLNELPTVVIYFACNGLQTEIGYLNLGEIIGPSTKFTVDSKTGVITIAAPYITSPSINLFEQD